MIDVITTAANYFMSPVKVEWYTDHTGHKACLQACHVFMNYSGRKQLH